MLQSFLDWKSEVKKKALYIKNHRGGTGGGPACTKTLSDLESICSSVFLSKTAIEGVEGVEEPVSNTKKLLTPPHYI